jgi:hypothetical protein
MKLKAFYVALALTVTIGPASANGLALYGHQVNVAETEPSRLYRAEWLSSHTQMQDARPHGADAPMLASGARNEAQADTGEAEAASDQISATLKAKIRAIIAVAREEPRSSADKARLLRSRIQVRCSVREVVARREPALPSVPALMLSQSADSEPARVTSTVEACTIKLLQVHRSETAEPVRRDFTLQLPPLGETP